MNKRPVKSICLGIVLAAAGLAAAGLVTPASAATVSRNCDVDSIGVIDGRMHIKCAPIPAVANTSAIYYFAMNLSEGAGKAQSLVALAIEAKRIKKAMVLWYDPEDYQSVTGCQGNNCRRLRGAALE